MKPNAQKTSSIAPTSGKSPLFTNQSADKKSANSKKLVPTARSTPLLKKNVGERALKNHLSDEATFARSEISREDLRKFLFVVKSVRAGDFAVRMPVDQDGIISEIGEILNDIIELNENMADEIGRVRNIVGLEGKMTERVSIPNIKGSWADSVSSLNELIGALVQPTAEAGKMPVDPKGIKIAEVKDYLDRTFSPIAEYKSLDFQITTSDRLPRTMMTDENRLQQILKNLLSNAFKFTENGKVNLSIDVVPKDRLFAVETLSQAKSVISFSVRDTGIGIPSDKQKLIFEAFQQADGTTSRKYGGTGLGLTISREIARLLGGIIEVQSVPGEGSTFTLYLPQNYVGQDTTKPVTMMELPRPISRELPKDANFRGRRILVVDDDMRNIFAITSVLESHGMILSHAENGKIAIEKLKDSPHVDLVLMDTMMPEMDGLQAMRKIREMPEFANLPIISLTAKAMKGDRELCISAGASDYITKPVDANDLLTMMHSWLSIEQQPRIQISETAEA